MIKTLLLCMIALIVLDILTGLTYSVVKKKYKSSVMRQGLLHKFSEMIIVIVAFVLEKASFYTSLNLNNHLIQSVISYIILMEIMSIFENVNKCNPDLLPDKLTKIFFKE